MNKLKNILWGIIVTGLALLTILFLGRILEGYSKYAGVGDYFNGVLSPFLGIITIILIYRTFQLQKQELQKTSQALVLQKEELQKTSEALWIQNFETFLNSAVNALNDTYNKEIFFKDMGHVYPIAPNRYDVHLKARDGMIVFAKENIGKLNSDILKQIRTESTFHGFKKLYSKYIQLYYILARKIDQSALTEDEKQVYMILIHSKLDNDAIEAILIFVLTGGYDTLLAILFKNSNYVNTLFSKAASPELCQFYDEYQSLPTLWPPYIREKLTYKL
jgi:hypothetical protein